MSQMASMRQIQPHNRISRLEKCLINSHIGACPRMWLYADMITAEKLFCTLDCKIFKNIHIFTAAIIAFSRISFRVFIGRYRSHRQHNSRAYDILRCDQLQIPSLPSQLQPECFAYLLVIFTNVVHDICNHIHGLLLLFFSAKSRQKTFTSKSSVCFSFFSHKTFSQVKS